MERKSTSSAYQEENFLLLSIKSTEHEEQAAFQGTEEFKELAQNRYKIEAKNSELKSARVRYGPVSGFNWHGNTRCHNNIRCESQANI